MSTLTRAAARRAFTLIELLIVVVILVMIIAVSLPAFAAMLRGSDETLAQARLTSAVRMGRDAAIAQTGDADVAIVFTYPPGGRLTALACVRVGAFNETINGVVRRRELFCPIDTLEPVQLPLGWMVRGFAAPNSIDPTNGEWYEGQRYGGTVNRGDWVFPETGFFNRESTAPADGRSRQSFMLRFAAGTGQFKGVGAAPVIVVLPRTSSAGRATTEPYRSYRFDTSQDLRRMALRAITNPARLNSGPGGGTLLTEAQRRQLLGDESTDTVLVGAVSQISLYREQDLARAVGAAIDRATGSIYRGPAAGGAWSPEFVAVQGLSERQIGQRISQWIEGDANFDGQIKPAFLSSGSESGDRSDAKLYVIDRSSGDLRRVTVQVASGD
jgi:prepilin-type N-terminal cleavage/methylation domain-containing protein